MEQKVIVFNLKNWDRIGPWVCNIRIVRCLNFIRQILSFFDFDLLHWVNWAQGWGKTQKKKKKKNFANVQFSKNFWNIVFPSFSTTSGANFSKIRQYLGELGLKISRKWPNSWILHCHENIWKFITWQPQMISKWNLTRLCVFMRPFIWQKIWAWPRGYGRAWSKNLL